MVVATTPYLDSYISKYQMMQSYYASGQLESTAPYNPQFPARNESPAGRPPNTPLDGSVYISQDYAVTSSSTTPDVTTKGLRRKQVKNACVHCQKACKKCDEGRPCQRCIKFGLADTCQDSQRKQRKKGVKRGPYRRRNPGEPRLPNKGKGVNSLNDLIPLSDVSSGYNSSVTNSPIQHAAQPLPSSDPFATVNVYDPLLEQKQHILSNQYMMSPHLLNTSAPMMNYSINVPSDNRRPAQAYPQSQPNLNHYAPQNAFLSHEHPQEYAINSATDARHLAPRQVQQQQQFQSLTPAPSITTSAATSPEGEQEDDDGNKLNLLSKLCTEELHKGDDTPKVTVAVNSSMIHQYAPAQATPQHERMKGGHFVGDLSAYHQTPPPSPGHFRQHVYNTQQPQQQHLDSYQPNASFSPAQQVMNTSTYSSMQQQQHKQQQLQQLQQQQQQKSGQARHYGVYNPNASLIAAQSQAALLYGTPTGSPHVPYHPNKDTDMSRQYGGQQPPQAPSPQKQSPYPSQRMPVPSNTPNPHMSMPTTSQSQGVWPLPPIQSVVSEAPQSEIYGQPYQDQWHQW